MQLEHCPFCGTKHSLLPDASGRYQQIVCGACGARGPEVYRFLPYAVAVESWNSRQGPSEVNETHRPGGVLAAGVTTAPALQISTVPGEEVGPFTVERHGNGWAIYRGRDMHHHGWNLGQLTETNDEVAAMIERALNAAAGVEGRDAT